ncbi:hypothetical protein PybrP1_009760 [[Pythium] brassicae (nom. inval.)]|nr:hypothetical protein PybrP1_009760 [[Pythium] brassicae (nom. inval.)]
MAAVRTTSSSDNSRGDDDGHQPAATPVPTSRQPSQSRGGGGGSRAYAYSGSRSSSSSGSYSFDPDTVGYDPGWTREYPCEFYPPDADGCAEYRSCFDCLNGGVVYKGRGCYVTPTGRCKPLATATHDKKDVDFRNATSSSNATKPALSQPPLYFPSPAAKYCAASDPICQRCKRTVFHNVIEYDVTDGLSNFCYGHDGCVCIAVCEAPNRPDLLGGLMCNGEPLPGHSGSSNQASSQANRSGLNMNANMPWLVGVPLVGAIMAVMVVSRRRRQRPRTSHLPRDVSLFGDHRLSSISGLSDSSSDRASSSLSSVDEAAAAAAAMHADNDRRQLRLDGWRALRNELIEREQLLIAGQQDFSSIGYVQLLDTSSSVASVSAASASEDGRESDADDQHRHSGMAAGDAQALAASESESDDNDNDDNDDDDDADGAVGTVSVRRSRPLSGDNGHSGDVSML